MHDSREEVKRGGPRDGCAALGPRICCKEIWEQLAWELTKTSHACLHPLTQQVFECLSV